MNYTFIYSLNKYINKIRLISFITFISIIIIYNYIYLSLKIKATKLNEEYSYIISELNINFTNNKINRPIRIGIYTISLSDGGLQRITAKLINYLVKFKIFKIYLFNQREKEENEYKISERIERVVIKNTDDTKFLIDKINKKKIDVFIYQFPIQREIKALNNLKNTKTIFYIHSSFFYWLYSKIFKVLDIYKEYLNSKYVISLIPLESDYLFKKWGINSILFENFLTYDYNSTVPSDLSKKHILLIGRGRNKFKRFEIGIQAIEYIKNKIPEVKLLIVSKSIGVDNLKNYIDNLQLNYNIEFSNYSSDPSIYFKDASLNYLTSISESYSLVLSETKIHGIPSILLGLDYIAIAKNGTIIIYDDRPETLAKESIKILFHKKYKKKLSNAARNSMKKFNNENIYKKWKILLLSVYNNYKNYKEYFVSKVNKTKELYNILQKQVILLNKRMPDLKNITISTMENLVNINISNYIKK